MDGLWDWEYDIGAHIKSVLFASRLGELPMSIPTWWNSA